MSDDPFAVLGVCDDATVAEIGAARRRLARALHPDHGGDLALMQAINAAHDEALRRQSTRPQPNSPAPRPQQPDAQPTPEPERPPERQRSSQRVQQDSPSFVVDAAPPHAHEALLVVAASIGEVIVSHPPHMFECLLDEPLRCWCRLDLSPEGESTSVSLIVERYDDVLAPDIDAVRDAWVVNLNQL